MSRSDALRDLYEAIGMLEEREGGDPSHVVDLRDSHVVRAGTLRHEVRVQLGADWDRTDQR